MMTSALNAAQGAISGGLGVVDRVATSVARTAATTTGQALGEFGGLVERMTSSYGNKPTPVESYVGMVTKQDSAYSTMA